VSVRNDELRLGDLATDANFDIVTDDVTVSAPR
jgi:hypothetical protein